jgi:hypothetical protein
MNVSDIYPSPPLGVLDDLSGGCVRDAEVVASLVIYLDLAMQAVPLVNRSPSPERQREAPRRGIRSSAWRKLLDGTGIYADTGQRYSEQKIPCV